MSKKSTTKFKIQYSKQKTPILQCFYENQNDNLGKDTKNNTEYNPLDLSNIQNYNPTYSIFFEMNDTNYNHITLNQKYKCIGSDIICNQNNTDISMVQPIFMKFAPLLDPLRYLVGTYTESLEKLKILPSIHNSTETSEKLLRTNNASYIDNFFCYLSSQLLNHHGVLNSIDYYGSALGIQSKFRFNVIDDLDYLMQSEYFRNNNGLIYNIDCLEDPFSNYGSRKNKNKLILENDINNDELEIDELEIDELVVDENILNMPTENLEIVTDIEDTDNCDTVLKNSDSDSDSESDSDNDSDNDSDSDINEDEQPNVNNDDTEENEDDDKETDEETEEDDEEETEEDDEDDTEEDDEEDDTEEDDTEEEKFAYIHNFPVQIILMEKCKNTLDSLFTNGKIQDEHMANAILMQVIMTLLVYQKSFHFTHNDLHTNNIMWNETELPFLYYKFANKIYKVPTYGKIFKIIDFGRSIYKFGGNIFCSDSFASDGDASSQYNCEPYFNEKKARLEPNYSFDLCRLGTSLYDFLFDQEGEPNKKKMDSFQSTIHRWCLDDEGRNVLYKKNGEERYPGFKLYKMIARCVHKHTPEAQLELAPFNGYVMKPKEFEKEKREPIIDIDAIPNYTFA